MLYSNSSSNRFQWMKEARQLATVYPPGPYASQAHPSQPHFIDPFASMDIYSQPYPWISSQQPVHDQGRAYTHPQQAMHAMASHQVCPSFVPSYTQAYSGPPLGYQHTPYSYRLPGQCNLQPDIVQHSPPSPHQNQSHSCGHMQSSEQQHQSSVPWNAQVSPTVPTSRHVVGVHSFEDRQDVLSSTTCVPQGQYTCQKSQEEDSLQSCPVTSSTLAHTLAAEVNGEDLSDSLSTDAVHLQSADANCKPPIDSDTLEVRYAGLEPDGGELQHLLVGFCAWLQTFICCTDCV